MPPSIHLMTPPTTALAHALPQSVGAVPLTVILTGLFALLLAVDALAGRRTASTANQTTPTTATATTTPPTTAPTTTPEADAAVTPGTLAGLAGLLVLGVLAVAGTADAANNLADVVALTLLWGFVALSSAVVGPWWHRVDPLRAVTGLLARAAGDPAQLDTAPLPERTALAGAVAGLLVWAWVQVFTTLGVAAFQLLLLAHVVVHVAAATRFGPGWLRRAEPLNVLSDTLGLLRPVGVVARLSTVADTPRLRVVAAVLTGWSLTELLVETEAWHELGLPAGTARLAGTALLLATTALLWLAIRAVADRGRLGPAFVAVAGGWVAAHYISLLLIESQGIPIWLSDPFATGADLLGRRDALVDLEPFPLDVLAAVQAVPFAAGHLLALVVVRRRAAARAPSAAHVGPLSFLARALVAVLLLGGTWLQLAGL